MKTALLDLIAKPELNRPGTGQRNHIRISLADEHDREVIYRLRHEVYAGELGQHQVNETQALRDRLDDFNVYIVASIGEEIAGFMSITPPGPGGYSIDKYLKREQLPFPWDEHLYEVRLLTVVKACRGRELAMLLMYAAFRWIESHGGTRVTAIGRREILDLYLKVGLESVGLSVQSGAVTYDVLQAPLCRLREQVERFGGLFARLEHQMEWRLDFPFHKPAACFHGGAFFKTIGEQFDALERRHEIVNADVLDAWFPPSPRVISALQEHLPWLLRTSPPTSGEGLVQAIAEARGVPTESILPGAGSSDLIFLALRQWLNRTSRVLILDPTYGEYAHVLSKVIRCRVERFALSGSNDYEVDLRQLEARLADDFDLCILVNPNSPTGRHIPRETLAAMLQRVPQKTKVWMDETYIEYAGAGQSLESFAAASENIVVCKSMSKAYALSGARAAYLCAPPHLLEELRSVTPPWAVSLLAQVAAVKALQDPEYYAERYAETHLFREEMAEQLRALGFAVVPGTANFLLIHLPAGGAGAAEMVQYCRQQNLFLRDASLMGTQLTGAIRIAVKDRATNQQMLKIIAAAIALVRQ